MALDAGSSDWAEAQSGDEYMDSLEPHWAVTNLGHLVDGNIKDSGGFTIRYGKGCSVGLCDECVDKDRGASCVFLIVQKLRVGG